MSDLSTYSKQLIAGHNNAGIKVWARNVEVSNVFDGFSAIASTNYWAGEVVRLLKSLSSGHIKDCVYINNRTKDPKRESFEVVMPGCCAQVYKRSNGEFVVVNLIQDTAYFDAQKKGSKPGLYTVTKGPEGFVPKFIDDGKVKKKESRAVAISDRYAVAIEASDAVAPILRDMNLNGTGQIIGKNGFDMHFTPGQGKIGGLLNIKQALNAANDPTLRESAILLAAAMEQAKTLDNISWISDGGGSGVLTQAMYILKSKGVQFSDTDHHVFFSHLRTDTVVAENLARDIGLKFDRKPRSVNYIDLNQLAGGLGVGGGVVAAWYRFKNDPEHTALRLGVDVVNEVSSLTGAGSFVQKVGPAVAGAVGFTVMNGASMPMPAAIVAGTAMFGVVGVGNKLAQAWMRDRYNKFRGRL